MIGGPAKIVTGAAVVRSKGFSLFSSKKLAKSNATNPETNSIVPLNPLRDMRSLISTCNPTFMNKAAANWSNVLFALCLATALPCSQAGAQDSSAGDHPQWANVTGRIVVEGDLPEIPPERIAGHKDRPVCLIDGKVPPDDQLVIDSEGGLRDVFVILTPAESGATIPVHPSYQEPTAVALQLDNSKCRFVPHAMAVVVGQTVRLTNSDSVGHNCKIASMNNEHNINLPAGGAAEIKLDSSDRVPANVTCDIHPWMDAVILAKEHPYVAITQPDGTFEMNNVPEGEWKLQFWHYRFGFLRKLVVPEMKVDRRGRITVQLEHEQTLKLGKMTAPTSAIK